MKLNCNVGDMALVVRGPEQWLGKIVTCQHYQGDMSILPVEHDKHVWRIDTELPYNYEAIGRTVLLQFCPDEYLKPLKWSDDTDEMLLIAGKAGVEVEKV